MNVGIFVLLYFHTSRPRKHIRVVIFFAHILVNSNCSIMIIIFAHISYGSERNARKYVLRENFFVYSILQFIDIKALTSMCLTM